MEEAPSLVAHEAFVREPDCRLDELCPWPRRIPPVRVDEPVEQAGDCDRPLADVEGLRARVGEVDHDLLHRAERPGRCGEEAVEHGGRAVRLVDEQEATPRRPGERAFRDECRKGRRQQRVDRVAAVAKDARARVCRSRVACCNRAVHGQRVGRCPAVGEAR
jgi:hypothetical protein